MEDEGYYGHPLDNVQWTIMDRFGEFIQRTNNRDTYQYAPRIERYRLMDWFLTTNYRGVLTDIGLEYQDVAPYVGMLLDHFDNNYTTIFNY